MNGPLAEVGASALLALVVGVVLWPPGNVYWTAVADAAGLPAVLVLVALLAALAGAAAVAYADLGTVSLGVGGGLAYVVGMGLIRVLLAPDSPAHWFLYAGVLVFLVLGGGVAEGVTTAEQADRTA